MSHPNHPEPSSAFCDIEIELAKQLHPLLDRIWQPAVGQYVWDEFRRVEKSSPFQTGVYFILNYEYFMTLMGGAERFRKELIWLPTWEQARHIARSIGIDDREVLDRCLQPETIAASAERTAIYRLLQTHL